MHRRRTTKRRAGAPMKTDLGVAWYKPEQWERLREISADANDLEATYDEWLRVAEEGLHHMREVGLRPERIEVDVEALWRWCRAHEYPVDAEARARYVAEQLRQRHAGLSRPSNVDV